MQYSSSLPRYAPVNRIRRYALAAVVVDSDATGSIPVTSRCDGQVRVAAVNISRLFREHTGMRQSLKELRQAQRISEEHLEVERRLLNEARKQLSELAPGSEAHESLCSDLSRREAELEARTEAARREFRQREARIYTSTYDAVVEGVRRCARTQEIGIVHRFDEAAEGDRSADESSDPFLRRIGQAILSQEAGVDITRQVAVELRTARAN